MLNEDCEKLVACLENMMADGVQLVHGGYLLSWKDTNILDIIQSMKKTQLKLENSLSVWGFAGE